MELIYLVATQPAKVLSTDTTAAVLIHEGDAALVGAVLVFFLDTRVLVTRIDEFLSLP